MVVEYSHLIESVMERLGGKCERKDGYYICQSPISEDNDPSFQWFENDGWGISYNASVEGRDRFSAKEICVMCGCYDLYIKWASLCLDIPTYVINKFKHLSSDATFGLDDFRELNTYKRRLFGLTQEPFFISYKSIIHSPDIKYSPSNDNRKLKKKSSSTIDIVIESGEMLDKALKYLGDRCLSESKNCNAALVEINNLFRVPAIVLSYPCGFKKIRFIDGRMRYISQGTYEKLFEARVTFTDKAYVVEGEIESLSILEHTENDVFSMHNKSSLPENLSQLEYYDEIEFLVDSDKFEESKTSIDFQLQNTEFEFKYSVREKIIGNKDIDFNDLLKRGMLSDNIIKEGVMS